MFFNKGLLITTLTIISAKSHATTINPITEFSIKPISCVVNKTGDVCQLNATVEWKATESIDVCLLQNKIELFCWSSTDYGKKMLPVSLAETSNFELEQRKNRIIASQKVAIASIEPKVKRRRLRSGWSIF